MKATELRIGNWVYNSTTRNNMQVYPMMIPQLCNIEKEYGSLKDSNIKPIPLTEEMLLKCGFDKDGDYEYFFVGEFTNYILEEQSKGGYMLGVNQGCCTNFFCWDIKYLHQLQNLYFALCEKELEVSI